MHPFSSLFSTLTSQSGIVLILDVNKPHNTSLAPYGLLTALKVACNQKGKKVMFPKMSFKEDNSPGVHRLENLYVSNYLGMSFNRVIV